jgi:hypothetical protein
MATPYPPPVEATILLGALESVWTKVFAVTPPVPTVQVSVIGLDPAPSEGLGRVWIAPQVFAVLSRGITVPLVPVVTAMETAFGLGVKDRLVPAMKGASPK